MVDVLRERVHVIATQHLDVAWLWERVAHGEELMRQCFQRAVEMIEAWPEHRFVFSRSTPWSFHILEQRDPELFEKVRKYVASGQIELCGGEWVEPDHMMPDGESLVRQCTYGQWYYQSRFGRMATVCWDPDIFSHSGTFPQIMKKAGMDGFYSHRCRPTDERGAPEHQFLWEGIDGSLVFFLSGMWVGRPEADVIGRAAEEMRARGYPATHVVAGLRSDRRITMQVDWVPLPASAKTEPDLPPARWSTAGDVLVDMRTYADRLPKVCGELGFQFSGTYTSNGHIKGLNRRLEGLLLGAEKASAMALVQGLDYPKGQFTQAWRELCINQFHDICCGCCYEEAHAEAIELFHQVERRGQWLLDRALDYLAARTNTDSVADAQALVVFNPLSWPHRGYVKVICNSPEQREVVTADGTPLPSQAILLPSGECGLLFAPPISPGIGLSVYYLRKRDENEESLALVVTENRMENEHIVVELDSLSGELTRLYDKATGSELLRKGGRANRLVFYEDITEMQGGPEHTWQPWKIGYTGQSGEAQETAIKVVESGPVRGCVRIERRIQLPEDLPPTLIVQDISLYAGSPMLYFETWGEWHARQTLLKAEFDLGFGYEEVVSEAPYGIASRPPGEDPSSVSASKDSMAEDGLSGPSALVEPDRPMQKWLDVSDGQRGLAFLNDSKYGYDASEDCIRISLLRSPVMRKSRDEIIGLGAFEFIYAVLPHSGDWRDADVPRRAYELNRPLCAMTTDTHAGIPAETLVSCNGEGVMVTAIKSAEDGSGIILRLFESHGRPIRAELIFCRTIASAVECDLLERNVNDPSCAVKASGDLVFEGARISISLSSHEIKTLRVQLT